MLWTQVNDEISGEVIVVFISSHSSMFSSVQAHVSVSHHNIVGSRYGNQEMRLASVKPLSKNGFSISTKLQGATHPAVTNFESPSLVAIDSEFGDGAKQTLELYIAPSRPGFSYHCGRIVILKDQHGATPKLLSGFTIPMPKWLNHVLASAFLHQDGLFLHHQERYMASTNKYMSVLKDGEEPYHYTKAISPSSSDMGVIMFRNWMRKLAGGRIPYKNNPTMPPSNNDIVFDVFNGHTKYCKYCQDALRRLKKARMASFIAATIVGILRPPQLSAVGSLLTSALFGGVGLIFNKLIGMFYRYEFSHAHND
jgi:Pheophorbide a oxygenase